MSDVVTEVVIEQQDIAPLLGFKEFQAATWAAGETVERIVEADGDV